MVPGFIYVLQNKLFGPYVVKIGFTTIGPDSRASQLYSGSTGVPNPFDVFAAYSVGDCKSAEKHIHKRLKAFRINGRREFFRMAPEVATSLVYETCAVINEGMGLGSPKPYESNVKESGVISDEVRFIERKIYSKVDEEACFHIELRHLEMSPRGVSKLTAEQEDRAGIVLMLLSNVYPSKPSEWLGDFTRDSNPEREICIWECIAKAFLTIDEIDIASEDLKFEAFTLLLVRSYSTTSETLDNLKLEYFTRESAKKLLDAYELKPKPIVVSRVRAAL